MLEKSILSYQGPLSFNTIDELLYEFKAAAKDHNLSFRTYKKMISVMIEVLENISKYSVPFQCNGTPPSGFCPSLQIIQSDSELIMETKNPVKKGDVSMLRRRIDKVNSYNSEELRELYISTITNGKFTPDGGAGLGFIEIAKTTGCKMEYTFENLTKDISLYTFRVSMTIQA